MKNLASDTVFHVSGMWQRLMRVWFEPTKTFKLVYVRNGATRQYFFEKHKREKSQLLFLKYVATFKAFCELQLFVNINLQ
jgi:hypothetical protein